MLSTDQSARVRRVVAARADLSDEELRRLAVDRDRQTRETVVQNAVCPPGVLLILLDDSHWRVRWDAIQHPRATPQIRRRALARGDRDDRWALAQLADLQPELEDALLADEDRQIREQLAICSRSDRVFRRLAADPDPRLRAEVALRDDWLDEATLLRLSRDPQAMVRASVAASHVAPLTILEPLTRDRSVAVRYSIAFHQQNESLLRMLFDDPDAQTASTSRHSASAAPVPIARRGGGWDIEDGSLHRPGLT